MNASVKSDTVCAICHKLNHKIIMLWTSARALLIYSFPIIRILKKLNSRGDV